MLCQSQKLLENNFYEIRKSGIRYSWDWIFQKWDLVGKNAVFSQNI